MQLSNCFSCAETWLHQHDGTTELDRCVKIRNPTVFFLWFWNPTLLPNRLGFLSTKAFLVLWKQSINRTFLWHPFIWTEFDCGQTTYDSWWILWVPWMRPVGIAVVQWLRSKEFLFTLVNYQQYSILGVQLAGSSIASVRNFPWGTFEEL